jgi:hypothetical protein
MKNIDLSELTNPMFNGALIGVALSAGSGQTLGWVIVGAILGSAAYATDHIRDKRRKANDQQLKNP